MWQPWGGEATEYLAAVAMAFTWSSMWLLGRKDKRTWAAGFVGDLLWLGSCLDSGVLMYVVNDIVFTGLRVLAWWRWRNLL